jgi:5'-3' exonuclease
LWVWDHGIPIPGAAKPRNWREDVVTKYKANRNHNNDEYRGILAQLPEVFNILTLLGYSSVSVMGLEADDVIGVLSKILKDDVLIFSTDKDFYQLLNSRVQVLVPKKENGNFRRISHTDVEKEFGIPVHVWDEYLALGGDSCDNIKPMRGMGPKTAIKLLKDGADLGLPGFKDQIPSFRLLHANLEPIWPEIKKSYYAAQIPTSWYDPRIKSCIEAHGIPSYRTEPFWRSNIERAAAKLKFEQFLADRNMVSLLALRHKFFEVKSNTERTPPSCPPPIVRTPKPRISLI